MLLEVFRLDKLAHWQSLIFWINHIVPSFVLVEDTGDTPTDPLTLSHWLLSTRSSLPKTWSKYYKGGHCCRILYNLIYLFPKKQSRIRNVAWNTGGPIVDALIWATAGDETVASLRYWYVPQIKENRYRFSLYFSSMLSCMARPYRFVGGSR